MSAGEGTATIVAYVANELADPTRTKLLERLLTIGRDGDRVLLIEPIARRAMPWWPEWERAFISEGGRADEWRFPSSLPQRQGALARAAGLDPRELTARSLYLPPTSPMTVVPPSIRVGPTCARDP